MINDNLLRRSAGRHGWKGLIFLAFLWLAALLWILPVLWMISTSLKPETMVMTLVPQWIPPVVTLENYVRALQKAPIMLWFYNSSVMAVCGTLLVLLVDAMAAYSFARIRFAGSKLLFIITLCTMMVPSQVTLIPLYLLFNRFNLLNTFWVVILPRASAAIGVFMLRQFFLGVPVELEDAVRIDGCSRYGIFWRIILPLARPALAALGIFTFVWSWNDYLWPLITLSSKEMYTLPIGIATLVGYFARDYGMLMAGAIIASIPTLIVFLFFQREFIQGITTSGLKG
ncbi:carbohydrate ABC transporter membrane protein 2 (CUT1 family) [Hydrogenispora ethanolica]|jgi:multiple sugar transport system permease protein|uniref:Carbohydrate ABC transporter membrane protein 2 (CUT1 family) n=1 Tax=Hydrogenispora ethanolica TaxID=1082276 RepID=A0A4R1R0J2_HYDET|nr:carbohydrate ABC transporter permease [Hydrogenispora ethanolica]TCL58814.1 carbohydrate ABC transporter membrane protein 2 (CUT1 family) [Hydrogenispora ethanolica]